MTLSATTRFAPSPTGFLHLGHVVSGLYSRIMAGEGGKFLIRIEDIDTTRCTPELTVALREDLDWLGLSSDGPVRQQSRHLPEYQAVLETLRERGLLYPCFCTRREIADAAAQTAPDGSVVYPGICRHGAVHAGREPVWRLDMGRALDVLQEVPGWHELGRGQIAGQAGAFGDIVLARRDTGVSYHLCVTHDDALQGVTIVTRGRDLYEATSVQRVLQGLMGWPKPLYAHHALIVDEDGHKLSKRDGAEGVRVLRQEGWTAQQVLGHPLVRQALETSFIPADRHPDR